MTSSIDHLHDVATASRAHDVSKHKSPQEVEEVLNEGRIRKWCVSFLFKSHRLKLNGLQFQSICDRLLKGPFVCY